MLLENKKHVVCFIIPFVLHGRWRKRWHISSSYPMDLDNHSAERSGLSTQSKPVLSTSRQESK